MITKNFALIKPTKRFLFNHPFFLLALASVYWAVTIILTLRRNAMGGVYRDLKKNIDKVP